MCRRKRKCTELGEDAVAWPTKAPLLPPSWFDEELVAFSEAVRLAANGDKTAACVQLGAVRGEDLQSWFIEHGQMSGTFRNRHFVRESPVSDVPLDSVASPERFAKVVYKRDGYRCRYCGLRLVRKDVLIALSKVIGRESFCPTGTNLERHGVALAFCASADHVEPWNVGGRTSLENLVCACRGCNFGKAGFTLDQIGVDDPRLRPVRIEDNWDGLTRHLPALRRHARQPVSVHPDEKVRPGEPGA
jgi:hypothetical protein